MNKTQTLNFTCKVCGCQKLTITRVWQTLAGPVSESWQEWGTLEADHGWHFEFEEKIVPDEDSNVERGDTGEFAEDDSDSGPDDYESIEAEDDPEADQFYVNCAGCDREIEFGWSQPNRGGGIFPVESADFAPGECWPEPRYVDAWQRKGWLPK